MDRKKTGLTTLEPQQLDQVVGGATGFNPNAPAGVGNPNGPPGSGAASAEDYDGDNLDDTYADVH